MSPQPLQPSGIGRSMPPAMVIGESMAIDTVMLPACAAESAAPSASARTTRRLQRRRKTGISEIWPSESKKSMSTQPSSLHRTTLPNGKALPATLV